MSDRRIKYLFFPLLTGFVFFAIYCSQREQQNDLKQIPERGFSVLAGIFHSDEKAESFVNSNSFKFPDSLRLIQTGEKQWSVFTGRFGSSYQAGKYAFRLFNDSLLNDYSITYRRNKVYDNYTNMLFVGSDSGRPAIYNFNMVSKKYEMLWSRWGRKVVTLNHTMDLSKAFITTALGLGWRGSLPYILDASVYYFDGAENEASKIADLGKGVGLYTYWDTPDTFKINFSYLDTVKTSVVYQRIISFDKSGRELGEKHREFDILKDGFPLPPSPRPKSYSPNGQFHIKAMNKGSDYIYMFENSADRSSARFALTGKNIYDIKWTDDSRFAFVVTENSLPHNPKRNDEPTGEFYVVSSIQKAAIKVFIGSRYKNFLVEGDMLILDERNADDSHIVFYDFVKNRIYHTLRVPGGCGLYNVPL